MAPFLERAVDCSETLWDYIWNILMTDILLGIAAVLCLSLIGQYVKRYHASEHAKIHGDFHGFQIRATLLASKVGILEQYVEEIWHESPQGVFEKLIKLRGIRDGALEAVQAISICIRQKRYDEASVLLIEQLENNDWEKRGHRLVLSLCKDLTLDATLAKKDEQNSRGYKRKPTLLSLKEIADMLREERAAR
jgi:hypothetical protein